MERRPAKIEGEATPNFNSLPDIARKLRLQAERIGARECYLFALVQDTSGFTAVPCLDFGHEAGSLPPGIVAARLGDEMLETAAECSLPLWWKTADGTERVVEEDRWRRQVATALAEAGLALPVCTERGQQGLAVFLGAAIEADGDMLAEVHARCHALFSTVVSLRPVDGGPLRRISKRELECLKLTANGLTSEEIARELGLSVHTANQYLLNTTQKLNAVNRVHAVAKALRAGLIS
jgi:DNA-binding CsgD family transcriptional regulator